MGLRGFWMAVGLLLGSLLVGYRPAQAAGGWQLVGWGGTRVGAVVVSPQRAQEVAAVVDGTLELSHDGGVVWLPCAVPARVNEVAYNPVQSGWLYAGSDTGLYSSRDNGLSWQRFESVQTIHKITVALAVDNQYVFASMYDGAGTPVQVFRISSDGTATATGFPDGNAAGFAVDAAHHRIYVGAADGVYSSDDEGQTWQGGGRGAGTFTNRVVLKPGAIWQLSADGLYRSRDDGQSWDRLAGPGDLNGTYYGSSMHLSGLAVSGGAAYYGAWSIGFPYQFLAAYSGGSAHSVFDGRVNDVAIATGRIWVATNDGLWVNNSLVGTEAAVRRPVIIVPGILGSLPTSEALKQYATAIVEEGYWDRSYKTPLELDPIYHTYDGLITYLLARGYRREATLFTFPYNWMQDNATTARQLAQKIQDVRQVCGCMQVDIVGHSMAGLIARSYIQSDGYQGDVANLIQLATPNAGSVDAYRSWESGEHDLNVSSPFFNAIVQALMSSKTDAIKAAVVRQSMPSIGQLLPIFDYLTGRKYPAGYPRNQFLEGLDQPSDMARLKQRTAFYMVGGNTKPTLQSLEVGAAHPNDLVWPDGEITGSTFGLGDDTVLQSSLETADKASLLLDADHGGIVTAAAPFVAQTLMGGLVDDSHDSPVQPNPTNHYLLVYAHGEVALRLFAPDGRQIDDTTIGVPGAYYSGSGASPQIIAIPSPIPGSYRIIASGSGAYTVGVIDTNTATAGLTPSVTSSLAAGAAQSLVYHTDSGSLQRSEEASASSQPPAILAQAMSDRGANVSPFPLADSIFAGVEQGAPIPIPANQSAPQSSSGAVRHPHRSHTYPIASLQACLVVILALLLLIVIVLQYL